MDDLNEYFRLNTKPNLTIGVNLSVKKLQQTADWIITEHSVSYISLNKEISKLLIGKPTANLLANILDWLYNKLKGIEKNPILLTDFDILFEPSFELDPLTIFKQVSRNTSLLVLWPGEFNNKTLSYASPEHTHYRTWVNPGVEIVQV